MRYPRDGGAGLYPLAYGIEENRPTIEALEPTAVKQGLTPRRMSIAGLLFGPEQVPAR